MSPASGAGGLAEFRRHLRRQREAGRKVLLLDFPQASHISYYGPVMRYLRMHAPDVEMVVMFARHLPSRRLLDDVLGQHGFGDLFVTARWDAAPGADLYLSTNQFTPGLPGVYSVCMFHGQPSKGITFDRRALETHDAFFFYGSLHRRALERYQRVHGHPGSYCPRIVEAGYPNSDRLFDGSLARGRVLADYGLDVSMPTLLYAPAFNEHASLRTAGDEITACLARLEGINVLVKLAGHTVENTVRGYSTGGIDWPARLRPYESDRLRLVLEPDINPCLVAADMMLTDVSGVAWDFLALGKPVLFWDCPDFYRKHAMQFDRTLTLEECLTDDSINAGRNFGAVVRDLGELERAVAALRGRGIAAAAVRESQSAAILAHSGEATRTVGEELLKLLRSRAKPRKPHRSWLRQVFLPRTLRNIGRPLVRGVRRLAGR